MGNHRKHVCLNSMVFIVFVFTFLGIPPRPSSEFAFAPVAARDDKVPDFKLPDLDNNPVQLKKLLKKGPVVIDFWATWCKPCIKYFPVLQSWHEKYGPAGLTIVAINEDGPRSLAKVKPFVRSLNVTFTVLVDENNEVMRRLRVQNLPTSFLVAADGAVIARHSGFQGNAAQEMETKIAELLPKKSE